MLAQPLAAEYFPASDDEDDQTRRAPADTHHCDVHVLASWSILLIQLVLLTHAHKKYRLPQARIEPVFLCIDSTHDVVYNDQGTCIYMPGRS